MKKLLEISCYSATSAMNAEKGGAGRVELCDSRPEGGTTPSYGSITVTREKLSIPLFVIIRPRGGDFLYSDIEFEVMKKDVEFCKEAGVDGIVSGILHKDGTVDKERTRELIELARPLGFTFHRAFDMTRDPFEALDDLIEIGADRVLTSGQEASAVQGKEVIKKLIERAAGRIIIFPGGELDENNLEAFARYVGAAEYHAAAGTLIEGGMEFRNHKIAMGGMPGIPEYEIFEADIEKIRKMVQVLRSLP